MLNRKVMVSTNKGEVFYGILDEVDKTTACVTLTNFVNLEYYEAGTYDSVFCEKGIIFDVNKICQCNVEEITIIENGRQN